MLELCIVVVANDGDAQKTYPSDIVAGAGMSTNTTALLVDDDVVASVDEDSDGLHRLRQGDELLHLEAEEEE